MQLTVLENTVQWHTLNAEEAGYKFEGTDVSMLLAGAGLV